MARLRILLVFGTRPEAIKLAPVYRELATDPDSFEPICCVTGQHRHLLDQVLQVFGIVPEYDLDLMREGQDLAGLTADILQRMSYVLDAVMRDVVLVQGDTTSSMAAAMVAFYRSIPVAHVEAGLRTGDLRSPFPEEFNRRATAMMARLHFAPTEENRNNLLKEGCDARRIKVVGNTVIDAVHAVMQKLESNADLLRRAEDELDMATRFAWRQVPYVLVTCHRRESFAGGIEQICSALVRLSRDFPDARFLVPVHPNPHVRSAIYARLSGNPALALCDPLTYPAFLLAIQNSLFVMTDSGGVQEEAPSFSKPLLVMRERTERAELKNWSAARLVGLECEHIASAASELLRNPSTVREMAPAANPFGDGAASTRIAEYLKKELLE
ncbi:non-hydrolyzing UDP-N-acetylglucosamine 2-epimerase [Qipengyuania sp.]|uniref:non-hydrolyzing UDP-N-acetylglucosamine 2-epimerase n=1 Tax=Qipengyuania sp. TaxID=2004515 RepID=UPI0035C805F0